MKISIIGAGNVGATTAMRIFEAGLADVVLIDIMGSLARGKALDIAQANCVLKTGKTIIGSDDYNDIKDSDIVIITAGNPRKPGMSRDDLLAINTKIITDISNNIKNKTANAIIIVVTNPLDIMTSVVAQVTGFDKKKVFGMAGTLDEARFIYYISQKTKINVRDIEIVVLGSHGDTMVPVISNTRVNGRPIAEVLTESDLKELIHSAQHGGAAVVSLLGSGSAYYAPSASIFAIVKAIVTNSNEVFRVSAYLTGEYELDDIYIGVPARISLNGITDIIEIDLNDQEKRAFKSSAEVIKTTLNKL